MAEDKIKRKIKKSENYKFIVNGHYVEKYWGKWRCFAVNKYIKVLIVWPIANLWIYYWMCEK